MHIKPFFSIITATYKDAWNLSKTIQSVISQNEKLVEYIVVDGNSDDETDDIVQFWSGKYPNRIKYIKEKDTGVYDAMNKGIQHATGHYICFMNAGDRFKANNTLDIVHDNLKSRLDCPGLLGWGELGGEVYVPWVHNTDDFVMGTLGFCHQSLFLKTDLAKQYKFDDRKGKIDSDRIQLSNIIKNHGSIFILHEILAIRSNDIGLSANSDLLKKSSIWSMVEYYNDLDEVEAEHIIEFKYSMIHLDVIEKYLSEKESKTQYSLALLVLEVLVMKPKKRYIDPNLLHRLVHSAVKILSQSNQGVEILKNINFIVAKVKAYYENQLSKDKVLNEKRVQIRSIHNLRTQNMKVIGETDIPIALTSFPGRMASLSLVLKSLFTQTIKVKKIYLFLAESQFSNKDTIPQEVKDFVQNGLEIIFVKNVYQYKKYLFMQDINKKNAFITVDDDTIYPPNMVEKLIEYHNKYKTSVISNRSHMMTYNHTDELNEYSQWKKEFANVKPDHANFATGVGGVLYPLGFVDNYCTNTNLIMRYAPFADDVWLKINAMRRGIKVVATDIIKNDRKAWYCGYTPEMMVDTLQDFNVAGGLNDYQMKLSLDFLSNFK